jgi:hypothetical protein
MDVFPCSFLNLTDGLPHNAGAVLCFARAPDATSSVPNKTCGGERLTKGQD